MSILKLKDSQGNWTSVPTLKGDKGNGIQSAVLNNDYTLTLDFTDGTSYTTPSIRGEKGEQGEPATDMDIHICSASEYDSETRIPTIINPDDKTFYLVPTEDGTSPDLFTEWVYVNDAWEMFGSASVDLTDYVKNTDIATTTKAGIVKINPTYGVGLFNDALVINGALANEVKAGNNSTKAVSTYRQHESTFYGLAKASGDTTQSQSDNPVGQYTDEAKSSIQNMLDVPSKSDIPVINVDDVQIDGQSIVTDGVANIPIAGTSGQSGVISIANPFSMQGTALLLSTTSSARVKQGTDSIYPLVPSKQHESAFYGLAKAAGDTTQSASSNAVGVYTDNAKDSIQNMLGISPLIAPHESDPFESNHVVGELFIINGKLYKAKTALTAGEYVNEGTNVEVVDIAEVLDDYATKQEIENNINIVEKNSNGSIASFNDGADNVPLKSLVVDIDPVQDLHGYDSPWVGGAGKNLLDTSTEGSGNYTITTTGEYTEDVTRLSSNYIPCVAGMTYTVSGIVGANMSSKVFSFAGIAFYDANKTFLERNAVNAVNVFSVTAPQDAVFMRFFEEASKATTELGGTLTTAYYGTYKRQLEEGSTATDWTPYENICPISGWEGMTIQRTGENLLGGVTLMDSIYAVGNLSTKDETAHTVTFNASGGVAGRAVGNVVYKSNTRYTFIFALSNTNATTGTNLRVRYTDGTGTYVDKEANKDKQTIVLVTPANKTVDKLALVNAGGYTTVYCDESGVFEGVLTASDFVPYVGQTIPINWQSEAGTVYGGKLDVLRGVLRITYGTDLFKNLSWSYQSANTRFYSASLIGNVKAPTNNANVVNAISESYKVNSFSAYTDKQFSVSISGGLFLKDSSYTDVNTFIGAMGDYSICYELATPLEIQLDGHTVNSLLGANNIWADTGDTSVEYFSQVDKYLIDYIETSLKPYAKEEKLNDYVSDVQIDGISIVENGITEIPFATSNTGGVVKVDSSLGIKLNDTNKLLINRATTTQTKAGTDAARPIVPICQHESVFYGLTKAAGVDMASSSNEVGIYTEEAKSAISDMLNGAIQISGTDPTIIAKSGIRYICGEVLSLNFTPSANGICDVMFTSGSTPTVLTLPNTVKMPEWFIIEANTTYEINIADGIYGAVTSWTL